MRERIRPRGGKLLYPYKSVMTTFSFDQFRIVCLALMTASCQRGKWNEEKEEEKERKKYVDSMKFSRPIIIHVRREGSLTPFENRSRTLSLSLSLFPPTPSLDLTESLPYIDIHTYKTRNSSSSYSLRTSSLLFSFSRVKLSSTRLKSSLMQSNRNRKLVRERKPR